MQNERNRTRDSMIDALLLLRAIDVCNAGKTTCNVGKWDANWRKEEGSNGTPETIYNGKNNERSCSFQKRHARILADPEKVKLLSYQETGYAAMQLILPDQIQDRMHVSNGHNLKGTFIIIPFQKSERMVQMRVYAAGVVGL